MPESLKIVYPDAERGEAERYRAQFDRLRAFADFDLFVDKPATDNEFLERIYNADGIILGWGMPGAVMQQAKKLRVISFSGIGVAQFVDLPQARERGITVCNCPGYSNNTVAEHALALLLSVARHIPRLDKSLRAGGWDQSIQGFELRGKTIGLIGFGGIGQIFSCLCKALGMRVIVWTKNMSEQRAAEHGIEFVTLDALYQQSDVISLHAAFNDETANLIDSDAFHKMKNDVLLINTARAELIDEMSLIDALGNGKIGGAGLDVFWRESLPDNHALIAMDNVVISPHVAYNTQSALDTLYEISVNNLVQYFSGNAVNVVQ